MQSAFHKPGLRNKTIRKEVSVFFAGNLFIQIQKRPRGKFRNI